MKRFIEGADRIQSTLFPECLEDWIDDDNPVRVIDTFIDELDLGALGFASVDRKATVRQRAQWGVSQHYRPRLCGNAYSLRLLLVKKADATNPHSVFSH